MNISNANKQTSKTIQKQSLKTSTKYNNRSDIKRKGESK